MGFENYIADAPSPVERYWDLFAQNSERRFLITSMKGQRPRLRRASTSARTLYAIRVCVEDGSEIRNISINFL